MQIRQRDAMPFPFRWFGSLLMLDDGELRRMLTAMKEYATEGTAPTFSGALAALWNEVMDRIDHDREHYAAVCEARREAGKKGAEYGNRGGRPKKNPKEPQKTANGVSKTANGVSKTAKTPDGDGDGDLKESILTDTKETAPLFSLPKDKETFAESSMIPGPDFTKWSTEQFKRSVDDAIAKKPEYQPYRDEFINWWTQPTRNGKYLFAVQKGWRTSSRLATFHRRDKDIAERDGGKGQGRGDIPADDFNARTAAEMRRLKEERA